MSPEAVVAGVKQQETEISEWKAAGGSKLPSASSEPMQEENQKVAPTVPAEALGPVTTNPTAQRTAEMLPCEL